MRNKVIIKSISYVIIPVCTLTNLRLIDFFLETQDDIIISLFTDIRAEFTVRVESTVLNCLSVARVLSRDLALFFFLRIKKSCTMHHNTREVIAGLTRARDLSN